MTPFHQPIPFALAVLLIRQRREEGDAVGMQAMKSPTCILGYRYSLMGLIPRSIG